MVGLITTKQPELESPAEVKARLTEASNYVPLDRLALSTQCGFASTIEGNRVTEDDQRRKLELVVQVARDVWGELSSDVASHVTRTCRAICSVASCRQPPKFPSIAPRGRG